MTETTDDVQELNNGNNPPHAGEQRKMSEFVGVFDVQSKLTGNNYRCRFSHMWNGIATRHAAPSTQIFVEDGALVVGLAPHRIHRVSR